MEKEPEKGRKSLSTVGIKCSECRDAREDDGLKLQRVRRKIPADVTSACRCELNRSCVGKKIKRRK